MISEVAVVKFVCDFLINERGYIAWVDSRFAAKSRDLELLHQIRIEGRIPDILARKRTNLIALECKGEREGGGSYLKLWYRLCITKIENRSNGEQKH